MHMTRIKVLDTLYAIRAKSDPQVMHSIVAKSFHKASRPLWRRDGDVVWVLSNSKPAITKNIPGHVQTKNIDGMLNSLSDGLRVAFKVQLNPTKSNGGKPKPLYGNDEQVAWATDRLTKILDWISNRLSVWRVVLRRSSMARWRPQRLGQSSKVLPLSPTQMRFGRLWCMVSVGRRHTETDY